MNRYSVTATQAIQMLREASQATNRKLSRVADELDRTREWQLPPKARRPKAQ